MSEQYRSGGLLEEQVDGQIPCASDDSKGSLRYLCVQSVKFQLRE